MSDGSSPAKPESAARLDPVMHSLADEAFCYLTTVGRRSGRPHTIEIWFALRRSTLYLLSGGGRQSDWVRNLVSTPEVEVRIGNRRFTGRARIIGDPDEDRLARRLLPAKYQPGYGGDLTSWRDRALPIAVDLVSLGSRVAREGDSRSGALM